MNGKNYFLGIILGLVTGCVSMPATNTSQMAPEIIGQALSKGQFKMTFCEFKLYSLNSTNILNFCVTYQASTAAKTNLFDWANLFGSEKGSPIRSHEFELLGVFVVNQILQYFDIGKTNDCVSIECTDGEEVLEKARADSTNWFLGRESMEYCSNTLAFRQKQSVVDLIPDRKNLPRNWVPLTRQSYPDWWNRVNQELHIDEIFGCQDAIKPPP